MLPGDDCGSCCGTRTPPVFQAFGSRSNSSNRCGGADRENSSSSCDSCEEDEKPNKRTVHQVTIFNIDSLTAVFLSALISAAKLAMNFAGYFSTLSFNSFKLMIVYCSIKCFKKRIVQYLKRYCYSFWDRCDKYNLDGHSFRTKRNYKQLTMIMTEWNISLLRQM